MIDVSEVVSDPDFTQDVTVYRYESASFARGGYSKGDATTLNRSCIVSVAREKELVMIPEGDRVQGAMVFYSAEDLVLSDEILWKELLHRVVSVADYSDYGYYKAVAVRVQGS